MSEAQHFTSVRFQRFKAFKDYSIALRRFNVLVGPNNSGKSTILGAFRILAEGMRKARSRNPEMLLGPNGRAYGYVIDLEGLPLATENVFYDYDDTTPSSVLFRLSNDNKLRLYFPAQGACFLFCETVGRDVRTVATFKSQYNATIGFVPILGPVEHEEPLYQREAARQALLTHRAARNFRNIWHHYPEQFEEFRELIRSTWPGMDIEKPEVRVSAEKAVLRMFCPEDRIPREVYWAGFGFQVWCQMLTYIVRNRGASLFLIDEPDIYLHADVQRQLLGILRTLGPDILMATHSTEIITEADPDDLVVVNKRFRSGRRIKDPTQLQDVFSVLGSNLNPVLTQLAKTRRALFVEGKDFLLIARFARKLGRVQIATRSDFAVIPVEGFNPTKVHNLKQGIEATLGARIVTGVIFDRDYRSEQECSQERDSLLQGSVFAVIHERKELENFLLVPTALEKGIRQKLIDQSNRTGCTTQIDEDIDDILRRLTDPLRHKVQAKYLTRGRPYFKAQNPNFDASTIDEMMMMNFDKRWNDTNQRYTKVPGKYVLAELNKYLQEKYAITLSSALIVECMAKSEIPSEMVRLIESIEAFRVYPVK